MENSFVRFYVKRNRVGDGFIPSRMDGGKVGVLKDRSGSLQERQETRLGFRWIRAFCFKLNWLYL